ncbi:Holliday junction branch migration protein RuvA [Psychromicrobium xiongbiense]|uniref:Holliday junction branch migration protein RuvA n=1 Tax=Psychromicrobium xiongbiense TaxID=3051184 RepID=UPI002555E2D6|nr:Holliday junction branch migration protein RuvA [Psychromicrobium sp. YIM S02556]
MISSVRGTVGQISLNSVVVEVGGVGLLVNATPQTLSGMRPGSEAFLNTALMVREDALTLYGFADREEREIFEVLLGVSGVGPRLGLAVLSVLEPEAIRVAVASGDGKALTKVPGIGPKVAARIVLELAGKLIPTGVSAAAAMPTPDSWKAQVTEALMSLGWSEKDAGAALDGAAEGQEELRERGDVAGILRATLQWLGRDGARAGRARTGASRG